MLDGRAELKNLYPLNRAMKLTAVRLPLPPPTDIDGLLARQLGPRLAQLTSNPAEFAPLLDRLRFVDDAGVHRFDATLYRGEDGPVYRAGTSEFVACFSQSAASECDDDDLAEQLEAALLALRASERR